MMVTVSVSSLERISRAISATNQSMRMEARKVAAGRLP